MTYRVQPVLDGWFALDGGAMFGVVPQPLWSRRHPPDSANRIRLALRCLLAVGDGRVVLIDTGIGDKFDAQLSARYQITRPPGSVVGELARAGIEVGDVTDVVLTHLHFDHAGGATTIGADGQAHPTFPEATYHVQRVQWEWANRPSERDWASFRTDDFAPLLRHDLLRLLDGPGQVLPGIEASISNGHTPGLQALILSTDQGLVAFPADLLPTASHLSLAWNMGFDLAPLELLDEKRGFLRRALDENIALVFEHDAELAGAHLVADPRGGARLGEPLTF